ncbi:Neuronal-specific septin-3 [Fulvia fulva]|uniref:Neuronal-specific septin-3 n=1 Tax=Passalora fulva TaxID=5499 RepID=A0A9Q8PMX3_PASFU|nr:Neuronal-specific septin-3 [Fulvia fulva]UJO25393.1 Neuronal-specific septin-3 [Fulvia fulva]WPV22698.1 Neuronal-specific septin-3 [Fulvia fulva]
MAAAFGGSDKLRNDVDYTVSHRTPPVPSSPTSIAYSSASAAATDPRAIGIAVPLHLHHQLPNHDQVNAAPGAATEATRDKASSAIGSDGDVLKARSHSQRGGRRPSLSSVFLRRSNTTSSQHSKTDKNQSTAYTGYTADETVPPVPVPAPRTLIAAAEQRAAEDKKTRSSSDTFREGAGKMLRKSSRNKAARQAEAERKANQVPRQAPHLPSLPSLNPTFGTDSDRPDSVAIFTNAYTHSTPAAEPRPTANFSRPGGAMVPPVSMFNSSSPAYRTGNGLPHSSSPPEVRPPKPSGEYVPDVINRSESMTNRGRYSYANSTTFVNAVNSPRRVRRRKDPTPFNFLVIGAKNCGKTSLISFLKHSLALPKHKQASDYQPDSQTAGNRSSFTSHYLETEIDGERVGLTMWDSAGLEKNVVDLQLREMTAFVESKFEDTFVEEQRVMRSPGVKDTHIHCVLLVLDPSRLDTTIANSAAFQKNGSHSGSLDDDLDLQVMRALWGKTTVIPVVSKADTLTLSHMSFLKRAVWQALKGASLDPLEALELEDDAEEEEDEANDEDSIAGDALHTPRTRKHQRLSSLSVAANSSDHDDETPYLPMSILSPDLYDLPPYVPAHKAGKPDKVGRRFPWGFADPYDPQHCDFGRLRDSIFSEWRSDLRELSRSKWYENWRTSRLKNLPGSRQRIKGGVTPVTSVPKEGRMTSQSSRHFSPPTNSTPSQAGTATSSVPRSVSVTSNTTAATSHAVNPTGMATVSENGGKRDFSGASQTGSVRGGTYRSVETYQ